MFRPVDVEHATINFLDHLPADFSSKYEGRNYLKVPQALSTDELKRLPNIENVGELLRNGHLNNGLVHITRDGGSSNAYLPIIGDCLIDINTMREFIENGHTIHINKAQLWNESAYELVESIHNRFGVRGNAQIFCTPRNSQGLSYHFDPEDFYAIQTEGTKIWKLYPDYQEQMEYPPRKTGFDHQFNPPDGEGTEVTLHAGDLLYIPRGMLHASYCTESHSCHIIFSIKYPSWFDYISGAIDLFEKTDIEFRKSTLARLFGKQQNFERLADDLQLLLKEVIYLDHILVERHFFEKDVSYNGVFSFAPLSESMKPLTPEMLTDRKFNMATTLWTATEPVEETVQKTLS